MPGGMDLGKNAKNRRLESRQKDLPHDWLQGDLPAYPPEDLGHPQERLLPLTAIRKLGDSGLEMDDHPLFSSTHFVYPSGYLIFSPRENGGNALPETEARYRIGGGDDRITAMPAVKLWRTGDAWSIEVHDYAPGPGPGDFSLSFDVLDDALDSIVSYFFDPDDERFQERLRARVAFLAHLASVSPIRAP